MKVRMRMNHSHTQKEGYKLSEDTVEIEFDERDTQNPQWMEAMLTNVEQLKVDLFELGTHVAADRNAGAGVSNVP